MGWDEALFGYLLKKLRGGEDSEILTRATLGELSAELHVLAAALSGDALKISVAEGFGGYENDRLLLPAEIGLFSSYEKNRMAYLYRLLATVTARSLKLALPDQSLSQSQVTEISLRATHLVEREIDAEFPRAKEILIGLPETLPDTDARLILFGALRAGHQRMNQAAVSPGECSPESLSRGTEKEGKPRERAQSITLGEKKDDENPLTHVFEKVLTADDYSGGKKNLDGSDELEEHSEALEELNFPHVVRSREKSQSIYRSDVMIDGGAPDLDDDSDDHSEAFLYDEWDSSKRAYRPDWCTVLKSIAPSAPDAMTLMPATSRRVVRNMRAQLEKILNERRWRARQVDGPEPDLDAVVGLVADLKQGRTPSDRVYLSRRPVCRDFAATILVDMSLSTDSWVENRHVIQVAQESLLILGEVLDHITTNVSVAAFYSNTRKDCRYLELKAFGEDWRRLRPRIPALVPTGYTRIGPAIRHGTEELKRNGAKKKLLLLISDGKPTDYDRYEGNYGIEDVRQAIRQAKSCGLHVRSLAIDAQAKYYLPRMFGIDGYQILSRPEMLAPALSRIFSQCLT